MKRSLYTILDEKAQTIGPVWIATSDSEAERVVKASIGDNTLMSRYPADFCLIRLGDVDMQTGAITAASVPVLVAKLDVLVGE